MRVRLDLCTASAFVVDSQLVQNVLDAVPNDFPLGAILDGNLFENAVGKDRRVHVVVRIELEEPDHPSAVMAADRHLRELRNRHFLAADNRDRANKAVFGIGTLFFYREIVVNPLVQHLQDEIRLFLVGVLGFRLEVPVGIHQKKHDGNRNDQKEKRENQLEPIHQSGVSRSW